MFKENLRLMYLTAEEADKLIECCNRWLKPIVYIAIYTGMRRGQILKLSWKNIDFDNNVIILEQTKSGYSRTIDMGDSVKEFLLDLKSKSTSEYVFLSSRGRPYKDIKTAFKTAVRKAELKDLKFHDLRHTYGTWLRASGADLLTIKELMGHRSLKSTERYAHAFEKFKSQRVNIMQRRFKINYGHNMVTLTKSEKELKTVKP
ncbi:site-specific integrase [candidate division WOR-3 bacterium]|nr:site-specific integrase [candidate division WOR-3 bacterium]